MRTPSLIDQFFSEEVSTGVRELILDAVTEHQLHGILIQKVFEFNHFDLTLNFETKTALIEDVLKPEGSSSECVKLDEFFLRLSDIKK
jgi:hypothetical protein